MQIASVLINGTEMVDRTLVRGFTITRDLSQRTGRATIVILAIPAEMQTPTVPSGGLPGSVSPGSVILGGSTSPTTRILLPGATVEIWEGSGATGTGSIIGGEPLIGEILPGGSTAGRKRWAGKITKITPRAITLRENGLGYTEYTLECQDYTALLDTASPRPETLATGSDQGVIRYMVNQTLPDINTDNVDSILPLSLFVIPNGATVRQMIENLCRLSGANFWIDENKALHYHLPTVLPAPFGISDTPDGVTSVYGLFRDYDYSEEFTAPGNRIIVIGGGATPPSYEAVDAASQSEFGREYTRTFIDISLLTLAAVTARANVELERYKQPQRMGRVAVWEDGLDIGQLLPIVNQSLGINGTFLTRRVSMTWETPTLTRYMVEFGDDWKPDLIRFLRDMNIQQTGVQPKHENTVVEFNADDTWTVPANVTSVLVECWGPGGLGGANIGAGGGGGAYVSSTIPVTPGAVMTVTVPSGGSFGSPADPTWFGDPTTILAAPGSEGGTYPFTAGGAGGQASASIGSTRISGTSGSNAPGPVVNGGAGGAGANGGGVGGAGGTGGFGGSAGVAPGGGGGGGDAGGGGGNGAPGRVKLTYSVG